MRVPMLVPFLSAVCLVVHPGGPRAQQQPSQPARPQQQVPDPAISPGERRPAPPDSPPKPQEPPAPQVPAGAKSSGAGAPATIAGAYASTYLPFPSQPTVIRNATILTAAGPIIERGSIVLQNGKVAAVGQDVNAPGNARSSTPPANGSRRASSTRTRTLASTPRPALPRCRTATR